MTQTRNEYNLDSLEAYLKHKPEATTTELYSLCNASTVNQKAAVRKKKSRLLLKFKEEESIESEHQKNPDPPEDKNVLNPPLNASGDGLGHLTNDMIEHYIVQGLKANPTNSQLIRAAVDFVTKIKSGEKQVQVLDLEKFLLIGEDNPDT